MLEVGVLGLVFFAGLKILELCFFRTCGIGKYLSAFVALPILRMCFRSAVCLCRINNLDIVIACRGIGIGVYRAAGDCEGHGIAESQVFGNINCNSKNRFCLIIVHSTADFHILLGCKSQRLAFAQFCFLKNIFNVCNTDFIRIDLICIKPQIFKVRAVRICGSDLKCNRLADCCTFIRRLLCNSGIACRQRAHRHERNEHQRHHQQTDNAFFHYVPPKF